MNETAGSSGHFWIYIIAGAVFFVAAVYLMPKIIRLLDKTAERRAAEKERKRKDAAEDGERKRKRYKTF